MWDTGTPNLELPKSPCQQAKNSLTIVKEVATHPGPYPEPKLRNFSNSQKIHPEQPKSFYTFEIHLREAQNPAAVVRDDDEVFLQTEALDASL